MEAVENQAGQPREISGLEAGRRLATNAASETEEWAMIAALLVYLAITATVGVLGGLSALEDGAKGEPWVVVSVWAIATPVLLPIGLIAFLGEHIDMWIQFRRSRP